MAAKAVRLTNKEVRYGPDDDAFPVFDVLVVGTEENISQFLNCIEVARDGGFNVKTTMKFENSEELEEDMEQNGNGYIKYE